MFWHKKNKKETPPPVTPDQLSALKMLQEARARKKEATQLNAVISDRAAELSQKRTENHFYQSFVSILRTE